jgi:hypothetical protein
LLQSSPHVQPDSFPLLTSLQPVMMYALQAMQAQMAAAAGGGAAGEATAAALGPQMAALQQLRSGPAAPAGGVALKLPRFSTAGVEADYSKEGRTLRVLNKTSLGACVHVLRLLQAGFRFLPATVAMPATTGKPPRSAWPVLLLTPLGMPPPLSAAVLQRLQEGHTQEQMREFADAVVAVGMLRALSVAHATGFAHMLRWMSAPQTASAWAVHLATPC